MDSKGRRKSEALVAALAPFPLTRILSSPYDRCVQTVEPLAKARGLTIDLCEELGEARQWSEGAALVRSLAGQDVALCVHGGLSEVLLGEPQKKGETLVLDDDVRLVERIRV